MHENDKDNRPGTPMAVKYQACGGPLAVAGGISKSVCSFGHLWYFEDPQVDHCNDCFNTSHENGVIHKCFGILKW